MIDTKLGIVWMKLWLFNTAMYCNYGITPRLVEAVLLSLWILLCLDFTSSHPTRLPTYLPTLQEIHRKEKERNSSIAWDGLFGFCSFAKSRATIIRRKNIPCQQLSLKSTSLYDVFRWHSFVFIGGCGKSNTKLYVPVGYEYRFIQFWLSY